ncbi:MAG: CoxG family protein [Nitrososphaerales archaeon]
MHYDGFFEVVSSRNKVYEFATDPSKITTIFPDVEDVKIDDEEHFTLKAKVGISFIKGLMDVKCSIAEKIPSTSVRLNIAANGLSSSVEMGVGFSLQDTQSGGTLVKWSADAKIAGMMVRLGSRLIDSVAEKYINQIVESLKQELS